MAMIPKSLLKDLPLKLQDSRVSSRVSLLTQIRESFFPENLEKNPGNDGGGDSDGILPELAAKGLAKVLPVVLPRYMDDKSRHVAFQLVETLMTKHGDVVFKPLLASLNEIFGPWATIYPTIYLAKISIAALQWTSVMAIEAVKQG
jgi:hypothetical protein